MSESSNPEQAATGTAGIRARRIFGSPGRYLQGPGLIDRAADAIGQLKVKRVALLCTERAQRSEGARLLASLQEADIAVVLVTFGGECSMQEIDRQVGFLRDQPEPVQALIALGGGKPLDTGKSIAHRLEVPVVVIPTLASNDSPCAAVSVIYTPEGVTESFEVFECNPSLVLVDTDIIAHAPARFLVAGMGDAMATWYEARACRNNPDGVTAYGARPTLAGTALARLAADLLFEQGEAALAALEQQQSNEALEQVVEANILLSGLGFEGGGLAASHAVGQALTLVEGVEDNCMHGEMVGFGVLTQLLLEADSAEATRVAEFFVRVGLPVTLAQLGIESAQGEWIDTVVAATLAFPFIGNMPAPVSEADVRRALLDADALGRQVLSAAGAS
jgi:glycerol dehydrogenase